MVPTLALTYNSQGGNGLLGMGWGISGLSAISRCGRTWVQDNAKDTVNYNTSDKYCLDGQRLVAVTGAYGADGTEYRTERESFTKIISYGTAGSGPAYFIAKTKAGQTIEFGNTTEYIDGQGRVIDSRIEAQGKVDVRVWAVNKISDTKGNYLTVSYVEDKVNGDYRPDQIDYTGNANASPPLSPYNSVRFVYQARTDVRPFYQAGSVMKTMKLLSNIQIYTKIGTTDTLVKDYRLAYDTSTATQRSRITTIQECDGVLNTVPTPTCLPATSINWQAIPSSFAGCISTPNFTPPHAISADMMNELGVRFVDVNGDGLVDMIYNRYMSGLTDAGAYLNTGTGWVSAPNFAPPHAISADSMNELGVQLLDVDGDGLVDMIYSRSMQSCTRFGCTTIYDQGAYLNTGSGWVSAPSFTPPHAISADTLNEQGVRFVDVNGDGLVDMIYNLYLDSGVTISGAYLNTGTGWVSAPNYTPPHAISANVMRELGVRFVDVNGDGLVDMIYNRYMSGPTDAGAYLNTPNGWVSAPTFAPPHAISADSMNELGVRFEDTDGDGLVDMIYNRYMASVPNDAGAYLLKVGSDRVTSIITGLNTATAFTYKPLTDNSVYSKEANAAYPVIDLQSPLYVVSSVATGNGIGGTNSTNYTYTGAKAHVLGGGFLGFHQLDAFDTTTGLKNSTVFRQDYPMQGLPLSVTQTQSNGAILNQVSNNWDYATFSDTVLPVATAYGSKHLFIKLMSNQAQTYDLLSGALLTNVSTSTTYDTYGNATVVTVSSADGFSKTTTNTYATPDTANWFIGRITNSTVSSTAP
jgi:hypothetical protein